MEALHVAKASRIGPLAAAALALAIALPSVFTGFCTDDHGFRAALRVGRPAHDLFRFAPADVARGGLPWWSAPDLRIHFLRPLTSLLFAADVRLFGDHAWLYHVHSACWYVALVALVAYLYRRVLDARSAAFAAVAFALAGGHAGAYSWIAAQHILVGAVPVVVALLLQLRGRYILAALVIALGLAGSEAAAAGAIYLVALEISRRRFLALVPLALVGLVYIVLYRVGHFGVAASGGYHDPIGSPIRFAIRAIVHLPFVLGIGLQPLIGLAIIALYAISYFTARPIAADDRNTLRWLVPASVVVLLIVGGSGIPSGRLLVVPDIGLAALVGVLINASRRPLAWALGVLAFVVGPATALYETRTIWNRGRAAEAIAQRIDATSGDAKVLFVVSEDPLAFLYARGVLADTTSRRVCWSALAAAPSEIRQTSERSYEVTPSRPLVTASFETLFRGDRRPFAVGDTVNQCGATIRVAAVDAGHPTKLELTLDRARPEHVAFVISPELTH